MSAALCSLSSALLLRHVGIKTHHFEPRPQNAQLAKPDVEGRAGEASIGLLDHHHVDGSRQRGSVDLIVEVAEVRNELPDVVHRIHDCGFFSLFPPK